jgi:hypothetical protein
MIAHAPTALPGTGVIERRRPGVAGVPLGRKAPAMLGIPAGGVPLGAVVVSAAAGFLLSIPLQVPLHALLKHCRLKARRREERHVALNGAVPGADHEGSATIPPRFGSTLSLDTEEAIACKTDQRILAADLT